MFKKIMIIGITCLVLSPLVNTSGGHKEPENTPASHEETKNISINKDKEQFEMIQATTQLALKRNGYKDDTSRQIDNWTITSNTYNNTKRWNAATHSNSLGRIKAIFEWSGEDNDDLILKYLFCDKKVIVDDLKE